MMQDQAKALARELVESNIQRVELERLELLNRLRHLEANLSILKARAEADIAATAAQLLGQ